MNETKVMNRWFVVVGAIMIQLALGAIYAWSVFTPALKIAGWNNTQTQWVFGAGLASFAVVMVIAGRLLNKLGPRVLALAGGVVLGAGYLLGGWFGIGESATGMTASFPLVLTFVGIVGGSGIGLAYVIPIAVGMKWFPDKKGMITGLAVAGFGFGAMGWVKLAGSWGGLLTTYGLGTTFMVYGGAFFLMVIIGAMWMVFPPVGYVPGRKTVPLAKPELAGDAAKTAAQRDDSPLQDLREGNFNSKSMLLTPQFYMVFLTFLFSAGAGLMSIGLMKAFPGGALMANGMSEEAALAIAGTAMAVFFGLANGLGRIGWGMISDKLGAKRSMLIMVFSQGVFVILFQWMAGNMVTLYIFAALIGFNFGGNFALFPVITAQSFGAKYIGQNYPWVFLAYGVGGIGGPIMGGMLGDMGNFPLAFSIAGGCVLAGGVLIALVRKPKTSLTTPVAEPVEKKEPAIAEA